MRIQVEGEKLIILFLLTLAAACSSRKETCPFHYVYHFGDGLTDIGNSIHVSPNDPNPARLPPYGVTNPGWPTGRWSDGQIDFDYTSIDFGVPNIVPYMTSPASINNTGVIFSVARSPVLPIQYFESKGIKIPSYAASLRTQLSWFVDHTLKIVCSTEKERRKRMGDSLFLMGDIEGNDVGYPLTQGKTIAEVITYVQDIVDEIMDASRVLIKLGAKRLIIPDNGPLGCYPYILSALWTVYPSDLDELGCLKSVNNLVRYKNSVLQRAIEDLQKEFPSLSIFNGSMFDGVTEIIRNASVIGEDGINKALKACCGIGGRYNYDENRFCGSSEKVPVCSNPNEYLFWDGLHFTQQAYYKVEHYLVQPALVNLNCTGLVKSHSKSSSHSEIKFSRSFPFLAQI